MNRIYFSQVDKRWKNHPYPSPSLPKATIGSGGCGATSAAMIISSFVGTIYPNQMGDIFRSKGFRVNGGTSNSAMTWIAKNWGLKVKQSSYINDAVNCLKNGGMCIALCKAGSLFSTGGHFIVLAAIRGNNLVVYDPYLYKNKFKNGNRRCVKVNGVEAIVSIDNFKKYCGYTLWCYEKTNKDSGTKYNNGQSVEVKIKVAVTGAKEPSQIGGNDVLVDDGKRQYWVHESVIENGNYIHARAIVCSDGGNQDLIQIFNRQFWTDEKNIIKKL